MYNEALFLSQIGMILISVICAKRLGREALLTLAIFLALFANLFVLKQMTLFGLCVTCSDAYVIGHLLCLNLLQQQYGLNAAKQVTVLSFGAMLLFSLCSQMHLSFMPSESDYAHAHYQAILGITPRLLLASLVTFYTVQQLDLFLFRFLMKVWPHASWGARSSTSLIISQACDTLLFTLLGLYGVVESWTSIFWMSFGIKCCIISVMTLLFPTRNISSYEI
ncbi:queuosine precursor transporter [Rhabdochlamydiaceae symbiont of Dictyostelium giganteum]|uniref:queuosine precursor transporter n=1 Tax=Rhabdochlamydiaceae symbiont of Dictyostelium giganteum TaxID=3342349 RepID=UPI00384D9664